MRHRKNITCLTDDELHDLREAYAGLYARTAGDPHGYATLAGFHGAPAPSYCRHGAPGFLTWHRAYLMAFEDALRSVRCDVTLPYWDWSSGPSTGVPAACREATYVDRDGDTVPNPLFRGPRLSGGQTQRRADIDTTSFDDLAASAQTALGQPSFSSFQAQLDGAHGAVHVRVGGDMTSVTTAGYDPIFYLHHANVDRLWAQWQAGRRGSLPATEASFELEPFNRPFSTQWQRGSDVESTDALGYRYLRFCLRIPPIRLWEAVPFELPRWVRDGMTSARLVLRSEQMPERSMEVRAFVGQPRASARTRTIGNDAFAGAIGMFGMVGESGIGGPVGGDRDDLGLHVARADVSERFDQELDITEVLRRRQEDDELVLKLVAIDADGDSVDADHVPVDDIELVVD